MYLSIIDFSFIYHKSLSIIKYYYNKEFTFDKKEDKGYLIRKVTMDLCKIVRELNSNNTIFCFDTHSFRHTLSPTYKGGRGDKEVGYSETQNEIFDIYTKAGINSLRVEGLEADDLMSLISYSPLTKSYIKIIVTGDQDLRQCIDHKVWTYNPDAKKKSFYYAFDNQIKFKPKEGDQYFYEKVEPFYILFDKIAKGCSSDKIEPLTPKGYRGVKVRKMYENLLELSQTEETIEDALFKAMNSLDLTIDRERFDRQLKMVYLNRGHMPKESVLEFDKTFQLKSCDLDFDMKKILVNTSYIDENYERVVKVEE